MSKNRRRLKNALAFGMSSNFSLPKYSFAPTAALVIYFFKSICESTSNEQSSNIYKNKSIEMMSIYGKRSMYVSIAIYRSTVIKYLSINIVESIANRIVGRCFKNEHFRHIIFQCLSTNVHHSLNS